MTRRRPFKPLCFAFLCLVLLVSCSPAQEETQDKVTVNDAKAIAQSNSDRSER